MSKDLASSAPRRIGHALTSAVFASVAMLAFAQPASAADEKAAQTLARQSGCLKCHAVDRKKEGPAYKDVAAKYRGKPEAEDRLVKHITSGEKVKFEDGHEEDHQIVKSKDAKEIRNLVQWILSLQ